MLLPFIGFGQSTKHYSGGSRYTGSLDHYETRHGKGTYFYNTIDDKTNMYYSRCRPEGLGKDVGGRALQLTGWWEEGYIEGIGTIIFSNGDKYVGETIGFWNAGLGTYTFANGDILEGKWDRHQYVGPQKVAQRIMIFVNQKVFEWKKKWEFEKNIDYLERVSEKNRNKKIKEFQKEALDSFKALFIKCTKPKDITLKNYDAENETFLINICGLKSFNLPVPISSAPSFKKNFNSSNFSELDLTVKDNNFIVSYIEYNGVDKFIYLFSNNICSSGDCINGYGVYTSEEGMYKGEWKDAKVHGFGVFDGIFYNYDGEYINGKQHGQGKKTYPNGTIEEGLFENGEFVGE